ncbi:dihydroorotate dehydrogenase electron transfer subunit [Patescibacteria group bacterium]|nr:dihydroorotate dehydrogenase electron transfer subunit [Patescibacteria group bacterium]
MKYEKINILPIKKIVENNAFIKTFYFEHQLEARPGQFVWLWLPGISEKPFSVGYQSNNEFGLTICQVGNVTKKIFELKIGDKVGIKGPYGTYYEIGKSKNIALVGGGYGSAPLSFLAAKTVKNNPDVNISFIIGAQTKNLLFIKPEDFNQKIKFYFTTDDGSVGTKGRVTDVLEKLLSENKIDYIATCGPELMQFKIIELAEKYKTDCQISLERYMKCSCGICGQCVVDPLGIRMCTEGPVINKELALKISEFGKYHRGPAGDKILFSA